MPEKKSLRILLIEDNEGDAFLLKFYLNESDTHEFTFDHAESLATAFSNLQTQQYDIILMDLNLPDSHGLASIKELLDAFPNNLVIVLTGLVDEKIGLEAVRYGAQDFLVKGRFDSKGLSSSIIYAFERYAMNSKLTTANKEIQACYTRYNNLLELTHIGYFEMDLTTHERYFSPFDTQIMGFSDKMINEEIAESIKNMDEISTLLNQAIAKGESGTMSIKSTFFQNPVPIKWKVSGNKLIIAIYYPEN